MAQCRRELFLEDDPATHPPRRLPLDRRLADRHQCLSRRTQCQPQTVCLDEIRRRHSGQTPSLPCTICLTQCTSTAGMAPRFFNAMIEKARFAADALLEQADSKPRSCYEPDWLARSVAPCSS